MRRILAVALLALAAGCVGPATQLRKDKHILSDDVAKLRAQLRKEQRANRQLETENVVLRDRLETADVEAGRVGDVPRLPVEVMEPGDDPERDPSLDEYGDDARVVGTEEDGTEIVYVGDAASGKTVEYDAYDLGGGDDDDDDDDGDAAYTPDDDDDADDPPPPKKKPAGRKPAKDPAPSTDDADHEAAVAYEAAVAMVKAKDHEDAITALRAFLVDHPRHDLADNAQYWLGEVYYDEKDWARALIEFRATVEKYPRGNKVPDALLKMGYCYGSLGQTAKAKAALEQVVQTYPRTQPAALAAKRLEEMS